MTIQKVSAPQFARMFALRPSQYAWFLGAGASASAGIPTGYSMITDFKKRLFCERAGVRLKEVDTDDPIWQKRIDTFLESRSILPPPGDPTEYAQAFEAVHPTQEDRRNYIEKAVEQGTPSYGHRVLASLIATRRVPCIVTPNFDSLVETSAMLTDQLLPPNERANLTVAGIENAAWATLALREGRPLFAKIHGDYRSAHIKNTNEELRHQDEQMRRLLTTACGRFGLVVVGYSGRDASVMEALTNAISQPDAFPAGIHWVARDATSVLPAVQQFMEAADAAGIRTTFVECQTFDELLADVLDNVTMPEVLTRHIGDLQRRDVARPVPMPTESHAKHPVLRCSAIPILSMPSEARRITTDRTLSSAEARDMLRDAGVRAVVACNGRDVVAFGDDKALERAFGPVGGRLSGTALLPLDESWALGLIYDALTVAVCRRRPIRPRMRRQGHAVMVHGDLETEAEDARKLRLERQMQLKKAYRGSLYGTTDQGHAFFEGVTLRLEQAAERWWLVYEPTTFVDIPRDAPAENDAQEPQSFDRSSRWTDQEQDWRRERWANRYNEIWTAIIEAWANMLAGSNGVLNATGIGDEAGVEAVFKLNPVTAWSRPAHDGKQLHRRGY